MCARMNLFCSRWLSPVPPDYEARTLGAQVETKASSVTWHYRNADPEFGLFQGTLWG